MIEIDKRATLAIIAVVLLCITILIRVVGINAPTPIPDELLWKQRSAGVFQKLRAGEIASSTTHLTHPGVPPALVMAAGQNIAARNSVRRNRAPGSPGFCDALCGSRMAIMLVSSLLIPLIFIVVAQYTTITTATLAAVFVALSPYHVFASRIAHLDALLTLLTLSTVFLYFLSVQKDQLLIKIAAGICFGLAIATKPTAALILPCLLLYKAIRKAIVPANKGGERSLVNWSDLWALIVGICVLSLVFTRLWIQKSRYQTPAHIRNGILETLRDIAGILGQNFLIPTLLVIGTAFFAHRAYSQWKKRTGEDYRRIRYHLFMSLTFLGFIGSAVAIFPIICSNQIRFWAWVVALQNRPFEAGGSWNPFPYGYPGLIVTKIPEVVLVLFTIGILATLIAPLRKKSDGEERLAFWLTCIVLILCWIIPLNKSQKQDFRYLLPIVPIFYMIAAQGMTALVGWIRVTVIRIPLMILPALYLCYLLFNLYPAYHLHFNTIAGGLKEARLQRLKYYFGGHTEALNFIKYQTKERYPNMDIDILIDGDTVDVFKASYIRSTAPKDRRFTFNYRDDTRNEQLFEAHYWIALGLFDDQMIRKKQIEALTGPLQPLYTYAIAGTDLLTVYEIPTYHFDEPLEFPIYKSSSHTGTVVWPQNASGIEGAIEAFPGKHEAGYLFLGNILRLSPGSYEVEYDIEFPGAQLSPEGAVQPVALIVQLANDCREEIKVPSSPPFHRRFQLRCVLTGPRKAGPSGYWPEKAAVRVTRLSISRRDLRSAR